MSCLIFRRQKVQLVSAGNDNESKSLSRRKDIFKHHHQNGEPWAQCFEQNLIGALIDVSFFARLTMDRFLTLTARRRTKRILSQMFTWHSSLRCHVIEHIRRGIMITGRLYLMSSVPHCHFNLHRQAVCLSHLNNRLVDSLQTQNAKLIQWSSIRPPWLQERTRNTLSVLLSFAKTNGKS